MHLLSLSTMGDIRLRPNLFLHLFSFFTLTMSQSIVLSYSKMLLVGKSLSAMGVAKHLVEILLTSEHREEHGG